MSWVHVTLSTLPYHTVGWMSPVDDAQAPLLFRVKPEG